jgi:hypothetical protein
MWGYYGRSCRERKPTSLKRLENYHHPGFFEGGLQRDRSGHVGLKSRMVELASIRIRPGRRQPLVDQVSKYHFPYVSVPVMFLRAGAAAGRGQHGIET